MCGIVGYAGRSNAVPFLLDGLTELEYRGYDSAGVAVMGKDGCIRTEKAVGRLSNLRAVLRDRPISGCTGIGHTRWATHGRPSEENAHPHMSNDGRFAVVHNGIIENHEELRARLQAEGCVFASETDTEVVAHLLEKIDTADMVEAMKELGHILRGSYALGILCADHPGKVFCIRKDSPLVIGLGENENYIASDIPALLAKTRNVLLLENREMAVVTPDNVQVYDGDGNTINREVFLVSWDVQSAQKGGYAHFMAKEIHEEPTALSETLLPRLNRADTLPVTQKEAEEVSGITLLACGTAYHAGVIGAYLFEMLAGVPAHAELASEYRYRHPAHRANEWAIALSQSGETADTLAAFSEAGENGSKCFAVTNVVGSSIARSAGEKHTLYTWAGPEIAVASTKAYVTQVLLMVLCALQLGEMRGRIDKKTAEEMRAALPEISRKAEKVLALESEIKRKAEREIDQKHVFFIGRGLDYAVAMEGSLKLKEVSYTFSEAYAAGELKHGTIALIEEGTLAVVLLTQSELVEKTLGNVREIRSRGARVICICSESLQKRAEGLCDTVWTVPDAPWPLLPLLAVIPTQLFAYHMAMARGCDVDKPRNLAKSVTVE